MSFDHAFEAYAHQLAVLGWPREWVRRNTPALQKRFAQDSMPFPPPPVPPEPARDRYEEL